MHTPFKPKKPRNRSRVVLDQLRQDAASIGWNIQTDFTKTQYYNREIVSFTYSLWRGPCVFCRYTFSNGSLPKNFVGSSTKAKEYRAFVLDCYKALKSEGGLDCELPDMTHNRPESLS